jgi:hypothetical protein
MENQPVERLDAEQHGTKDKAGDEPELGQR